jgi:hypothetical protein
VVDVLHTVDDRRALRFFNDIDKPLHAQQIGAAIFRECRQQQRQRDGMQRLVAHDAKARDVILMMMLHAAVRFVRKPARHIRMLAGCIVKTAIEQCRGRYRTADDFQHRRARIDSREPRAQRRGLRFRHVGLGQDQAIGDRRLAHCFGLGIERIHSGHRIDGRNHAVKRIHIAQAAICHQRMQDRRRICKSRGFDHDALEGRHRPRRAARGKIAERQHEIASHVAAQAAVRKLDKGFVAGFNELMIETDCAEFVDDDGRPRHRGIAQQAGEQRGLAAAQEAGDY